jgi:hypothetical protein
MVIGNEVLSGSITDTNTPWLAKLLYRWALASPWHRPGIALASPRHRPGIALASPRHRQPAISAPA